METVAFTTIEDRVAILDAATSVLVTSNFSITLANERLGLLQTDYVPLSSVQSMFADSLGTVASVDHLLMRITMNTEAQGEVNYVQLKGSFQEISGSYARDNPLVRLFWLERIAKRMAAALDVDYKPQLADSTYALAVTDILNAPEPETQRSGLGRAARAVAVALGVIFVVTLAVSTFGPGAERIQPTQ